MSWPRAASALWCYGVVLSWHRGVLASSCPGLVSWRWSFGAGVLASWVVFLGVVVVTNCYLSFVLLVIHE